MKQLARILSLLCAIMLSLGAIAEESATVTVEGVGEHVTVTLTMEDDRIKSVEASSDNTEADERGRENRHDLRSDVHQQRRDRRRD